MPRATASSAAPRLHLAIALGLALAGAVLGVPGGALAAAEAAALPTVDAAQQELHGTIAGQRFWARLTPADKQFGNNRVMQLVYTPPASKELDGAHVSDCPFLLIDPQLRVVAWNGRDSGSKALPGAPNGYAVTRELAAANDDKGIELASRAIPGERGWDLRIAPILLAIGWKAKTSASVRVVDLFGPRHAEAMTLTWADTAVTVAGVPYTITPDEAGRLKSLAGADGATVLTVAGHL
jgi:hypothetical protein